MNLQHEHLYFQKIEDFHEWKKTIERTTFTSFRTRNSKQTNKEFLSQYTCHRSGLYEPRTPSRQRRLKQKGSKKINGFCPAEIAVRRSKTDGTCKVYYVQTHLGHTVCDKTELAHVFISKEERQNIAFKISAGIPYDKILKESVQLSQKNDGAERLRLLCNKDLHNIAASYRLKRPLAAASSAPATVESFVIEHTESILYYKKTNETDEEYPFLRKEDAILVLMTQSQMRWLLRFGGRTIAVCSTNRLCHTNLVLYSILVFDDYFETYAVAFAVSNRRSEQIVDVLLECVKGKVGAVRPKKLVTEANENHHSSWSRIMGDPEGHSFTTFHARETWRRSLQKIDSFSKRRLMMRKLREISSPIDEGEFAPRMRTLLASDDLELRDFAHHFETQYGEMAALCCRKRANVRTDRCMETFHRLLKYSCGQPNMAKDLVSCLNLLSNYVIQKEIDYGDKKIKGRSYGKMKELSRRHEVVEDPKSDLSVIESVSEGGWYVSILSSNLEDSDSYFVRRSEDECENCKLFCEKCGICIHKYRCTCADSSIAYNMCRHIHVLCSSFTISKVNAKVDDGAIDPLNYEINPAGRNSESAVKFADEAELLETPEALEITKGYLIQQFSEVVGKVSSTEQLEMIKRLLNSADIPEMNADDSYLKFDDNLGCGS